MLLRELGCPLAVALADRGERVLFLCYNRNLCAWLQEQANHDSRTRRAGALLEKEGVTARVEKVAGDFFAAVPQGGDAYIMKHIIHDWPDEKAMTILRNCRKAVNPGGKLLLVEAVRQLRGECGDRQVADAEVALAHGTGGILSTHATVLLDDDAAGQLVLADYYRETYANKPPWQGL